MRVRGEWCVSKLARFYLVLSGSLGTHWLVLVVQWAREKLRSHSGSDSYTALRSPVVCSESPCRVNCVFGSPM